MLGLGAPFQDWVPNPYTTPNPKWSCHNGTTMGTNSPSAGTGTLQHPSARTGMVTRAKVALRAINPEQALNGPYNNTFQNRESMNTSHH